MENRTKSGRKKSNNPEIKTSYAGLAAISWLARGEDSQFSKQVTVVFSGNIR